MSGGYFDYFYLKLEDLAKDIAPEVSLEEKELSDLLLDLSEVLYTLEWWKSGDTSYEDFQESWLKFKETWLNSNVLNRNLLP